MGALSPKVALSPKAAWSPKVGFLRAGQTLQGRPLTTSTGFRWESAPYSHAEGASAREWAISLLVYRLSLTCIKGKAGWHILRFPHKHTRAGSIHGFCPPGPGALGAQAERPDARMRIPLRGPHSSFIASPNFPRPTALRSPSDPVWVQCRDKGWGTISRQRLRGPAPAQVPNPWGSVGRTLPWSTRFQAFSNGVCKRSKKVMLTHYSKLQKMANICLKTVCGLFKKYYTTLHSQERKPLNTLQAFLPLATLPSHRFPWVPL